MDVSYNMGTQQIEIRSEDKKVLLALGPAEAQTLAQDINEIVVWLREPAKKL